MLKFDRVEVSYDLHSHVDLEVCFTPQQLDIHKHHVKGACWILTIFY
jgi:hypothetical protein